MMNERVGGAAPASRSGRDWYHAPPFTLRLSAALIIIAAACCVDEDDEARTTFRSMQELLIRLDVDSLLLLRTVLGFVSGLSLIKLDGFIVAHESLSFNVLL